MTNYGNLENQDKREISCLRIKEEYNILVMRSQMETLSTMRTIYLGKDL